MNLSEYSKIILLVEPNNKAYRWFSQLLEKYNKYTLVRAASVSKAIKQATKALPDLVICNYELHEPDGFHTYKLLRNSVLKNGVPFIVIFPDNSLETIQLGLELGIDNFIFPPYDEIKTVEIIRNTLSKADEYKALKLTRFEKFFCKSPVAVFITKDNRLEKANTAFYKFLDVPLNSPLPSFDELFDFENNTSVIKKLNKCLNGKISDCFFADVLVKSGNGVKVDLQVSNLHSYSSDRSLVQIIIKNDRENINSTKEVSNVLTQHSEKEEEFGITIREIEILKFSSRGLSIKQIAQRLGISDRTVEKHRSNIMRKTNTSNIIEAFSKIYAAETNQGN
uniref:LuxR C-terminal-related transcriptional regulator n=1 Tax=uncultured Draconibacterium sp. TaxID=1573823 RepID=UPI0032168C1E